MEWYLMQESDDFLSTEEEMLENNRSEHGSLTDDWLSWPFDKSKNFQLTCQYPDIYKQDCEDLDFGDQFVFTGDTKDAPSQDSDESTKFADWEALTSADFNRTNSEESPQDHLDNQLLTMEQTDDIFLNQFLDEDVGSTETRFQALQMFPDSMCRSLPFDNMFSSTELSSPQSEVLALYQNGYNTMDGCGFPLFMHDLTNDLENTEECSPSCVMQSNSDTSQDSSKSKVGPRTIKRTQPIANAQNPKSMEEAALQEFEVIMFELTEKTRICFRDAFYRLAISSRVQLNKNKSSLAVQDSNYTSSRVAASKLKERATNLIDRTVANLTFNHQGIGSTAS